MAKEKTPAPATAVEKVDNAELLKKQQDAAVATAKHETAIAERRRAFNSQHRIKKLAKTNPEIRAILAENVKLKAENTKLKKGDKGDTKETGGDTTESKTGELGLK